MNSTFLPDLLTRLAQCVCTALKDEGAGPLCWCGAMTTASGNVSWDLCGECGSVCGTGYVALHRLFPYTSFPIQLPYAKCSVFYGAELTVGALRCAPSFDDFTHQPPKEDVIYDAAAFALKDSYAIFKALSCCDLGDVELYVRDWRALGPQGGCQGGEWTVLVSDLEGAQEWPAA